jgi:hypothetical protein
MHSRRGLGDSGSVKSRVVSGDIHSTGRCSRPPTRERERASRETCADVSEPALTACRSPRHGAPGGDPTSTAPTGQSSTPLSARRHRGRTGAYPRVPDRATPTLRAIGRVTAPTRTTLGDRLPGMGCSSRLPLTGHPLPEHAGVDARTRVQRRRPAGDRDGRQRPRRVVVHRRRSKLGAPCPYQSAFSCLLSLGAGR